MTKLTIEIPDSLHRTIKSFASANGETIKDFFIAAVTEKLKKLPKNKIITKKPMKKNKNKLPKYISEKEADKMLKPYLLRLIKRIENGEEEVYSWEEVKRDLKNS
jgi:hypothetical protein